MSIDIILIDDSEQHLHTASHLLADAGLNVKTLSNPLEAVSFIKLNQPRLVIMDIMMPGMDGFSLLKTIKEDEAIHSIPVIILSGKVFPPDKKKALKLGAEKFLTKPINSSSLLKVLKEYL